MYPVCEWYQWSTFAQSQCTCRCTLTQCEWYHVMSHNIRLTMEMHLLPSVSGYKYNIIAKIQGTMVYTLLK